MPKITVIAPVYGVEKYIDQFLESIRQQTFQDFEMILVDDGSKDNCPAILDAFAQESARYRVIHQENGGVSKARNTGIEQITGEFVYIVDSDDWLEPTALEVLWREAQRTQADIVYGDWVRERSSGAERLNCFPQPFVTDNPETIRTLQFAVNSNNYKVRIRRPEFDVINHMGGAPWRALIRASIILDNNLRYDPYVRGLGDDILFSLHLYEHVKKVAYIQEVIYHYRIIDSSYSHGFKPKYFENISRIFEKQEKFLKEYNKDVFAWESYYTRVLTYLLQGMKQYFRNPDNQKPEKECKAEFNELIRQEPYRTAIKKAPLKYMLAPRVWITTLCLKMGLKGLYWKVSL